MNPDFADMLSALSAAGVDFLIVGAHALAAHGVPRATGDLDIWVRPTPDNAARTLQALTAFGAPLTDLSAEDLTRPDTVFQMGVPPARIDILSGITGVSFEEAWARRVVVPLSGLDVPVAIEGRLRRQQDGRRPSQGPCGHGPSRRSRRAGLTAVTRRGNPKPARRRPTRCSSSAACCRPGSSCAGGCSWASPRPARRR